MTTPTGCAHRKVEYRPQRADGRVRAQWVCEGCWEPFVPLSMLEESVTLQSHYAALLNAHDGGRRILFKNAKDWLARLAMSPEERVRDPRMRNEKERP